MIYEIIEAPEIFIDPHAHLRGFKQSHKTTPRQTLLEARNGLISVVGSMPNTDPPIDSIPILEEHNEIIQTNAAELGLPQQYTWFGSTDNNRSECDEALKRDYVLGLKGYAKKNDGTAVTTGSIGITSDTAIHGTILSAAKAGKAAAFHCDDPYIIAIEGNTIHAEASYVARVIRIGWLVKDAKIVICHVSCRDSAELIIAAQKRGMNIMIEICAHYIWFDSDGTNWNPSLAPVYYLCYNNLRPREHREYLCQLLASDVPAWIASDVAGHTEKEKDANPKLGGIPSNQEMVAAAYTIKNQYGISNERIADLLSYNAAKFLNIPIPNLPRRKYELVPRKVTATYNNGVIVNPWADSELLFPEPI